MKVILVRLGILLLVIGLIIGLTLVFFAQVELILNFLLTITNILSHPFQIAIVFMVVGGILVFLGLCKKVEPDKEKPKYAWIATVDKVDEKDFEDTRKCLLNSYHSYVQTHAGYIIGLIIGASAVIYSFNALHAIGVWGIFAFVALILVILGASLFFALRIFYWTLWANVAIIIPIGEALEYFNNRKITNKDIENIDYLYKAPNTNIIQIAINGRLNYEVEKHLLPWYKKLALKTKL